MLFDQKSDVLVQKSAFCFIRKLDYVVFFYMGAKRSSLSVSSAPILAVDGSTNDHKRILEVSLCQGPSRK